MYRLFIDIPIEALNVEEAVSKGQKIMDIILEENKLTNDLTNMEITQLNYRLGDDEDRTPKNYFVINSNGHATSKKTKIILHTQIDSSSDF